MGSYIFSVVGFAAAAAVTRLILASTKTRLQIIVFLALAAAFELLRGRLFRQRPSAAAFIATAAAVSLAALSIKIATEGPLHKPAWLRYLLHALW